MRQNCFGFFSICAVYYGFYVTERKIFFNLAKVDDTRRLVAVKDGGMLVNFNGEGMRDVIMHEWNNNNT